MRRLPFQCADAAHTDFQYLEDLATGYWYAEVLFAALELRLFDYIHQEELDSENLARRSGCNFSALERLLRVLSKLELVGKAQGHWFNSQLTARYLVSNSNAYLGHFLLYRRYMKTGWETLLKQLAPKHKHPGSNAITSTDDYDQRNFHYVRAMDTLAREKAHEICERIPSQGWHTPILDIGGGAGALSRALLQHNRSARSVLLELPEVIRAARQLYPATADWKRQHPIAGDFRNPPLKPGPVYGLILMGNFLHAYGAQEARTLLEQAVDLLAPTGLLVIHDYFPDRAGRAPHKGALYDLCMMLNTYDGTCHESATVQDWLQAAGLASVWIEDLSTDSTLILAAGIQNQIQPGPPDWCHAALANGFLRAVEISIRQIVLAPWPAVKCRYGCDGYGQRLQCPPHCMEMDQTRELLASYTRAVLVEGAPPGLQFHDRLLALERQAFLAGYHKALVFGAGPCPVCAVCPQNGPCRHPQKARPSMEGVGMDVYKTTRNAGIPIEPVSRKGDYVKYIGLLLLE